MLASGVEVLDKCYNSATMENSDEKKDSRKTVSP